MTFGTGVQELVHALEYLVSLPGCLKLRVMCFTKFFLILQFTFRGIEVLLREEILSLLSIRLVGKCRRICHIHYVL